jgi:hypothetical protein
MATIRKCFLDAQSHNPAAQAEIVSANDRVLLASIERSRRVIPDLYDTRKAIWWTAYVKGYIGNYRIWRSSHNYGSIRDAFQREQHHNPNARNLLANYSDDEIGLLIDGI